LVQSMNDLATRGLRHAERLQRLGLWGLMPRPVYDALHRLAFSGVRLPPPLRDMQDITLTLDRAVNSVIDQRRVHPTDSADLLNLLLRADGGTWPRRRIRDEALTFMLAGHETTANSMSWFWYLMTLHTEARDRMLAEVDEVLGTRRPGADDLGRLPWTTACLQESQRYFSSVWIIARRAIQRPRQAGAEQRIHRQRRAVQYPGQQRLAAAFPFVRHRGGIAFIGFPCRQPHLEAALGQEPRHDKTVAAIIARPAQDGDRARGKARRDGVGHGAAGIFHQGPSGCA